MLNWPGSLSATSPRCPERLPPSPWGGGAATFSHPCDQAAVPGLLLLLHRGGEGTARRPASTVEAPRAYPMPTVAKCAVCDRLAERPSLVRCRVDASTADEVFAVAV